ncbi:MAG: hypothetical protein CBD18_02505 [Opitutales bacterium TMED158]|nr:MAG: hypothetical protein CBD18_02505 [Opitutales bacterium TMED158]
MSLALIPKPHAPNPPFMSKAIQSKALRYAVHGSPFEALSLDTLDLPPLQDDSVALKVLAAPINPADFGCIGGSYGSLAALPGTGGLEGVAEVIEVGANASRFSEGDRVLLSGDPGSWQTVCHAPEDRLAPAPDTLDDLQAAMFWVNPATAWRMMRDFAQLSPGDCIIQNAATSAVGKLVIQFANHLGIRTINLVRSPASIPALLELGGTHAFLDDREAAQKIRALPEFDRSSNKLGLNAVGGSSALNIAKALADNASLVTYGGMDRDPAPFPTRYLIFNNLSLRGFWVSEWYRKAKPDEIESMHEQIARLMKTASIRTEIAATYPIEDWRAALTHSQAPGKSGKVLFDFR